MAREKKSVARRNQSAFGLTDSSTTTSPSESLQIKDVETSSEAGSEQAPGTQEDIRPEQAPETQQALSNQQAPSTEEASSNPGESSLRDTKVKRSKVWKHFKEYQKIVKGKDDEGNLIDIVQDRAHCIHCPRGKIEDFVVASGKNGTLGMIRHMDRYCRYFPTTQSKSQKGYWW
ncbi:hypothetical protein ACLB2K_060542 [Fragaria x ananassa]